MVQSLATMYQLDCDLSNSVENLDNFHQLYKKGFQEKASSQVYAQRNFLKNDHKGQGVKLQPLAVSKESDKKVLQCADKGHISLKHSDKTTLITRRKAPSKIPVLQKSFYNQNGLWDSTLSAADRRQKFHQSHLHVISPCSNIDRSDLNLQKNNVTANNFFPWCNVSYLPKVNLPLLPVSQKAVLPPIKTINAPVELGGNSLQMKKKCLFGEITHFPALCNLKTKRLNNPFKSTVPYLPNIFPAAPPPSISTSLELDGSKVN